MNNTGINIKGMAPLLMVFDMPTSLHFYRDILGFTVKSTSADGEGDNVSWCLLGYGETELMLNELYERDKRPAEADQKRNEVHYDTSLYFGCPDTDAAYAYLTTKGITVNEPIITSYNFKALYLEDPDGYSLVFHWPV